MELKAEVADLKKDIEMKDQKLKDFTSKEVDQLKSIVEFKKENESLKHSLKESAAKVVDQMKSIENLKKSNEGLKNNIDKMNHKNANNQIKHLELMVKHEQLTKSIGESILKKSLLDTFKCKKCGKAFESKSKLDGHQPLH